MLRCTGMKDRGLILHPEELRLLEVQGKDGNICTLCSEGPQVHKDALNLR